MTVWFVSRHPGALEWARRRGIDARPLAHLDPGRITRGDTVIGSLPVHLAAEVCQRGATYLHLTVNLPAALRGSELDADTMERLGAEIRAYDVGERLQEAPPAHPADPSDFAV